jgi:hypothetical protein
MDTWNLNLKLESKTLKKCGEEGKASHHQINFLKVYKFISGHIQVGYLIWRQVCHKIRILNPNLSLNWEREKRK